MPTYGDPAQGGPPDYGGTSGYDASATEMLRKIMSHLGIIKQYSDRDLDKLSIPPIIQGWYKKTRGHGWVDDLVDAGIDLAFPAVPIAVKAANELGFNELLAGNYRAMVGTWTDDWFTRHTGDGTALTTQVEQMAPVIAEWSTGGVEITSSQLELMAEAVWAWQMLIERGDDSHTHLSAQDAMEWVTTWVQEHYAWHGIPLPNNPSITVCSDDIGKMAVVAHAWAYTTAGADLAAIPWTDRPPTISLVDWLNTLETGYTWQMAHPSWWDGTPDVAWAYTGAGVGLWLRATMPGAALYDPPAPGNPSGVPVWPGLGHVVVGSPISVGSSGRWDVACDGVLLQILTLPAGQGRQVAGDVTRYPNLGWIAFISDNGDAEPMQYLGIAQSVYMPHTLTRATGLAISCKGGLTMLVTPWSRL